MTHRVGFGATHRILATMDGYRDRGYDGPVPLLSGAECRELMRLCRKADHALIPDWPKALAVAVPEIYRVSVRPAVLNRVKKLIGNDVILWGASFVRRAPGQIHHWHNDIESVVEKGKTVSVWIALEIASQSAAMEFICRSHRFQKAIQEVRHENQMGPGMASKDQVLTWARAIDPECSLHNPEISNGEGIFFDGWIWHATQNLTKQWRTALLLQYATPDTPVRIPDPNSYEWPFKTLIHPKPPCLMLSGRDNHRVNRIVTPPIVHDGWERQEIGTQIYPIGIPLSPDPGQSWKPFQILRGSTPNLQSLTIHASALAPGQTPHPPHQHREDEILILLHGEADVTLPDLANHGEAPVVSLRPGEFVFYPAWFFHTITARGSQAASYLMLKWYNDSSDDTAGDRTERKKLQYGKHQFRDFINPPNQSRPFRTQIVFEGETDCLALLQCHTSVLQPGAGYPAHIDAHDVAIVVMNGEVESMGARSGPNSILFFAAGQPHDMRNPSDQDAEYLVFEFHGTHPAPVRRKRRTLWQKMRDPQSWKAKMGELRGRLLK